MDGANTQRLDLVDHASRRTVPLVDLSAQHGPLHAEMVAAVERVLASGRFVLGPDCGELEAAIARLCRVPHAIACASGSDALILALRALEIGPGDEVIVPSYTFFATVSAVELVGATPVFADIEPLGYLVDPAAVAAAITPATRAIIPVHLYGQCASLAAIKSLAASHGLAVIEDAAQAIGATYHGAMAGAMGDIGCFSFYPTKNLGGCGDGGMLTVNDDELAARLRLLRVHGMEPRYHHQMLGANSRLDSIQAALLNVKLPHLERWTAERTECAARYQRLFETAGLDHWVGCPELLPGRRHVWNQFVIRVASEVRDDLRRFLGERGIGTEIYYPIPMHLQPCFAALGWQEGSLPETERAARETIALPIYPGLSADDQQYVAAVLAEYFIASGSIAAGAPHFSRTEASAARRPVRHA